MSGRLRAACVLAAALALSGIALVHAADAPPERGEAIYLRGVLASGGALQAVRPASGIVSQGADAACVNCHQRSGLGTYEGYNDTRTIPPITGLYLFHARGAVTDQPILPYVEWMHGNRDPYTDATLARAIREGVDSQGRPLSYLMPRFDLNDSDMAALIDYLKRLDVHQAPGVTDTTLHFATVITPDADPAKRKAMLEVMQRYFDDKNRFPIGNSRQMRTSGKTEYAKSMFMSHRLWQLHVWELTGPASTWQQQLDAHMAGEPVLALVSGLGGSNWEPVHRFCERARVPCLFPNVEVPVDDSRDFYPLYFSKGVLLEAALIDQAIGLSASAHALKVHQIYRAGDSGEAAARALGSSLRERGITSADRRLAADAGAADLADMLKSIEPGDVLVLWLRPGDLRALGDQPPPTGAVFVSGLMGGLESSPLPQTWRSRTRMAYPVDLPERRGIRMRYPESWFSIRHIPIVDERVQSDTYLACGLLAETLSHMADNFTPAYMVEMLQSSVENRLINTGYYPRMVLGWNQHFVSKGGYIVHFAAASGDRIEADTDWTVP